MCVVTPELGTRRVVGQYPVPSRVVVDTGYRALRLHGFLFLGPVALSVHRSEETYHVVVGRN